MNLNVYSHARSRIIALVRILLRLLNGFSKKLGLSMMTLFAGNMLNTKGTGELMNVM
jgi:hypothetical protein